MLAEANIFCYAGSMEAQKQTFAVATYNIFDGRNTNTIIDNILELIQSGASVICLQEVRLSFRDVEFTKILASHLPKHFSAKYFLESNANWFDYGLGILWDTTILSSPVFYQLRLPEQGHLTFWNKLFYWMLGLTPKIIKRGALIGTFRIGKKQIRITNLHLDFQGGNNHRASQLKSLTDYLASQTHVDYEIISGDFNSLGLFKKREKILTLESRLGDKFKSVLTHPYNSAIIQQLDYIFTKNLEVRKTKILKLKGSDHNPLLAELTA